LLLRGERYLDDELAAHAPVAHRISHAPLFENSDFEETSAFGVGDIVCRLWHAGICGLMRVMRGIAGEAWRLRFDEGVKGCCKRAMAD
jgi:hypothetical protein